MQGNETTPIQSGDELSGSLKQGRLNYIDAAKGVAVILVVLWHATDSKLLLLQALSYLRMPLFFFAAGLFAHRGLSTPWREFITDRVGQIGWLFVLWTPVVFFTTEGVGQIIKDELTPAEAMQPFDMFIDPPQTLWFLYALGIMYLFAKLVRHIEWYYVIAFALTGYALVINTVLQSADPLLHLLCRVVLLAPFFLIGCYHSKALRRFVEEHAGWGGVGLVGYGVLAACILAFDFNNNPAITFSASTIGILSLLMILYHHDQSTVVRVLNKIGGRSLFVFVLHRIPLFYYVEGLEALGMKENVPARIVGAFGIVVGCWLVGEYVLSRYAKWTMQAPWLIVRSQPIANG